MSMMIMKDWKG